MPICTVCKSKFPVKKYCTNKFCSRECYYKSLIGITPKGINYKSMSVPWNKGKGISKTKELIYIDGCKYLTIPLTKGKKAIIDEQDFEKVNQYKWHLTSSPSSKTFYAKTSTWNKDKKCNTDIKLHRFILDLSDSKLLVDHINHNGLDNRKCNLRVSTTSQNTQNSRQPNKYGYKGIYLNGKSWVARIKIDGKIVRTYGIESAYEAAIEYDRLARKYFGDFALTNF